MVKSYVCMRVNGEDKNETIKCGLVVSLRHLSGALQLAHTLLFKQRRWTMSDKPIRLNDHREEGKTVALCDACGSVMPADQRGFEHALEFGDYIYYFHACGKECFIKVLDIADDKLKQLEKEEAK